MSNTGEMSTSEVLETLQCKGDYFTRLTIIERKRLADLDEAIGHINQEISSLREKTKRTAIDIMNLNILTPNPAYQRADGNDITKQANQVTNKMLHILEAKLDKLLQRKSDQEKKNRKMKEEIDHMRRLRIQTNIAHASNIANMSELKENIEQMMGEANGIFQARDTVVRMKEEIEKQNFEEQKKFEDEYEEMGHYIRDQNANLEEELMKERTEDLINDFEFQNGDLSVEEEDEMAGRVGQLTSFVVSEQNSLANVQRKIYEYEKMFEQLKKITNKENLEEVISIYSIQEEEMFSLYNYIRNQTLEIEIAVDTSNRIRDEIQRYEINQQNQEDIHNAMLDNLLARLQHTQDKTAILETKNKIDVESVQQIAKKVQSLFFKLQCDQVESGKNNSTVKGKSNTSANGNSAASRHESKMLILTGQGVTESNVLDYMGAVEHRAVNIIADYIKHQGTNNVGPRSPTAGPSIPMQYPRDAAIDFEDFDDEEFFGNNDGAADDVDSKPVDLTMFKEKLSKKLTHSSHMAHSGGAGTGGFGGHFSPGKTY